MSIRGVGMLAIAGVLSCIAAVPATVYGQSIFEDIHLTESDGLPEKAFDDPDEGTRTVNVLEPVGGPSTNRTCVIVLHGGGQANPDIVWVLKAAAKCTSVGGRVYQSKLRV